MEEIKRYGIYEFDPIVCPLLKQTNALVRKTPKENLIFVLKYRTWTQNKINAINSLVIKYFLSDRIVDNVGPSGRIEIKPVYKRVKNVASIDVEKVAGHLHDLFRIFKALKFVIDKL